VTPAGHASDCCEPWCGADASCDCGAGVGAGAGAAPDPCATSHKELFYANDFSYLKDRSYQGSCLGDRLKLMPVAGGDWGPLDIGGQWRLRYHGEQGMGREITAVSQDRFQDTNNDFLLSRLRLYTNWKLNDKARIFVEGILANATDDGGDYFSRGIDYNRGDFLNLYRQSNCPCGSPEIVVRCPTSRFATGLGQYPSDLRRCPRALQGRRLGGGCLLHLFCSAHFR